MIRAVVVDDEAPARERMRHLLLDSDVTIVAEAGDGDSAIEQIDALTPDVVFLDIQMPVLTGLEVAARLRAPRPRIVFCTAYDQFAIDAFELHAVDYLLKPVNRERLLKTVGRLGGEIREQRDRAREMADAVRTQARMMPNAIVVNGLECAAVCRPAQGVGGDYYDVLPAGGGRVALTVADVSGKGIYAGILAAAIQARLQAIISRERTDPADTLTELNRLTVGSMEGNRFATIVLAIYEPAGRALSYANAGHTQGLVMSPDGAIRMLEATGPAIGWTQATFTGSRFDARRDDLLVLCSDGITEASAPDGSELGIDGLANLVRAHAGQPVTDIVHAVLDEVDRFTGGAPAADDRTLLVARVL